MNKKFSKTIDTVFSFASLWLFGRCLTRSIAPSPRFNDFSRTSRRPEVLKLLRRWIGSHVSSCGFSRCQSRFGSCDRGNIVTGRAVCRWRDATGLDVEICEKFELVNLFTLLTHKCNKMEALDLQNRATTTEPLVPRLRCQNERHVTHVAPWTLLTKSWL